jgi:acetyl esterase/lipase
MQHEQEGDAMAMLRAPLVYRAPGMETVTARRGIGYRGGAEGEPRMDVYQPRALQQGERRPAAVFIHGGPISPQLPLPPTEWGVYRGYGALAAASGWIGVTFNHRYFGFDQLERAADDIAAAIAYLREHADELNLDRDRLCLWAFSGGGPFLAATLRTPPAYMRCLVAYYTVMDLRPLAAAEGVGSHLAAETLRRFSPVAAMEEARDAEAHGSASPPLLVARAGQDNPSLNKQLDAFVQAALAANAPLDLLNHPAGYHSFDARNDDARTQQIISHTLDFIAEHMEA